MPQKSPADYYLILATVAVLSVISLICVFAMFFFKYAQVDEMAPAAKALYMGRMNGIMAPFVVGLVLLLGLCVPKRLLPLRPLAWFAGFLTLAALLSSLLWGVQAALLLVLVASLLLQLVVLALAVAGSPVLNFEKKGYWLRLGSSLVHLGLILFVLDLFFHRWQGLHLFLFWLTTGTTVCGMLFCFYADWLTGLLRRREVGQ
jgi:hypothetical protein